MDLVRLLELVRLQRQEVLLDRVRLLVSVGVQRALPVGVGCVRLLELVPLLGLRRPAVPLGLLGMVKLTYGLGVLVLVR